MVYIPKKATKPLSSKVPEIKKVTQKKLQEPKKIKVQNFDRRVKKKYVEPVNKDYGLTL